jgi:hypothetical protein
MKGGAVRVSNDPGENEGATGPYAELFRLQNEFQARLAEETLRYLRRVQGTLGPAAPGTVVLPDGDAELAASGSPGGGATLRVEVENLQRVHCILTPSLSPLVSEAGATWFPEAEPAPGSRLLAPGETADLSLTLRLPATLPPGRYRGALLLQGFRQGALPVAVTAEAPPAPKAAKASKAAKAVKTRRTGRAK